MASLKSRTQTGYTELYRDNVITKNSYFKNLDLMAMTVSHLKDEKCWLPFERGMDRQRLSRRNTRHIMGRIVLFGASTETFACSAD